MIIIKWISLFLIFFLTTFCFAEKPETGEFILQVNQTHNPNFEYWHNVIAQDQSLKRIVTILNHTLSLPRNLYIKFDNDSSPAYSRNSSTISIGYNFLIKIAIPYIHHHPEASRKDIANYVIDVVRFILYHEIAHVLIHLYHLPVIGNEEIAADNLSVVIALEFTKDGYEVITNTFDYFKSGFGNSKLAYWDEHPIQERRFYNVLCLVVGKYKHQPAHIDPKRFGLSQKAFQEFIHEQGNRCQLYYKSQIESWMKLLRSHIKKMPNQIQQGQSRVLEFTLILKPAENKQFKVWHDFIVKEGSFERIVKVINHYLELPYKVDVVFKNKGEARYDDENKSIELSYQMMENIAQDIKKQYPTISESGLQQRVASVTRFVFYRNLANVLINIYRIAVVGDFEIATDDFAAVIAYSFSQDGERLLKDTLNYFKMNSIQMNTDKVNPFYNFHSTYRQRFLNLACLMLGHAYIENIKISPEDLSLNQTDFNIFINNKQTTCAAYYRTQFNSWRKLMQPYLKTTSSVD